MSKRVSRYVNIALCCMARHSPFHSFRKKILSLSGVKIGKNVHIGRGLQIHGDPKNIIIGDNVDINYGVYIDSRDKVIIGDNTAISPFVTIFTHSNPNVPYNKLGEYYPSIIKPVKIEKNTWIGARAIILQGIKIGEMSVVGAGSVVIEDTPPFSVVAGVPAKIVKRLINSRE